MRIVQQKISKDIKRYAASQRNVRWHQDPKGYFLIRAVPGKKTIEAAFCTNSHVITMVFSGKKPVHLYYNISQQVKGLRPEHYAYLGKELYHAWVCMRSGVRYVQDDELPPMKKKR